jgi:predicted nucleic acid-binding protein
MDTQVACGRHDSYGTANQTEIEISRRLISRENCRKPNDRYDMKFLEVALATEATLITQDSGLLNLSPYKCGRKNVRIVTPADYLNETICS